MGNDVRVSNVSVLRAPGRRSLRAVTEDGSRAFHIVARFAQFLNPLLTRRRWAGTEHIPRTGPCIVVSNHTSNYDPLLLGEFIVFGARRWPRYLGKAELWKIPVIGWIARVCEQIPVYRDTDQAGNSLIAAEAAIARGHCVCIYPEGTITEDPDTWPMTGRRGAAHLALKTGAPLIPLVGVGIQKVLGQREIELWRAFGRRKPVDIMAGPPIDLSAYTDAEPTRETLNEVTDLILDTLTGMVAELRDETPPEGRFDSRVGRRVVKHRAADQ